MFNILINQFLRGKGGEIQMKNYTKKSLKTSNGITLIALVITIIVLLILAGISISMLSGDKRTT